MSDRCRIYAQQFPPELQTVVFIGYPKAGLVLFQCLPRHTAHTQEVSVIQINHGRGTGLGVFSPLHGFLIVAFGLEVIAVALIHIGVEESADGDKGRELMLLNHCTCVVEICCRFLCTVGKQQHLGHEQVGLAPGEVLYGLVT